MPPSPGAVGIDSKAATDSNAMALEKRSTLMVVAPPFCFVFFLTEKISGAAGRQRGLAVDQTPRSTALFPHPLLVQWTCV